MSVVSTVPSRASVLLEEAAKVPAFLRRDLLVAWSYRMAFFSDLVSIVFMVALFFFISKMLDPGKLPTYNGVRVSYMEFVLIGIALGAFIEIALARVASALRNEQVAGTLEALLMTPTAMTTVQLGSAAYDIVYVPIRTGLLLLVGALAFGMGFQAAGIGPALAVLLLFIPFVWGLGIATAGAVLTFKRGGGGIHLAALVMMFTSGAYFPIDLFPSSVSAAAQFNPMALAADGMRQALLGGAGWSDVAPNILLLAPMSAVSLTLGVVVFRLGLRREQARGTLGLY